MEGLTMDEFFSLSMDDKAVEEIFEDDVIIITEDDIVEVEEPENLFLYDMERDEYEM